MKLLNERISDTVYHITHFDNLRKILTQDKFNLTYAKGGTEKRFQTGEKQYFLSTSRSITGQYILDTVRDTFLSSISIQVFTILELDGKKLSTKYTGKPVDYFGKTSGTNSDETEDRIISKDPFIENASTYIKRVYVWIPYISESDIGKLSDSGVTSLSRTLLIVKRILSLCKSKNIPVKGLYLDVDTIKSSFSTVKLLVRAWKRPHLSEKEILKIVLNYFKILRVNKPENVTTPGELDSMSNFTVRGIQHINRVYILNIFLTVSSKSELIRQLDRHFKSTTGELDDIKNKFVDSVDHIVTTYKYPFTTDTAEMKEMQERVEELVNRGRIGAALVYVHTYLSEIRPGIASTVHWPFSYAIGEGLSEMTPAINYNGSNVDTLKVRKFIRGTMSLVRRRVPGLYRDLDTVLFSKITSPRSDDVANAIDIVLENILEKLT